MTPGKRPALVVPARRRRAHPSGADGDTPAIGCMGDLAGGTKSVDSRSALTMRI